MKLTERDHLNIIALASAGLLGKKLIITYKYLDHKKGIRELLLLPKHFVKGVRGGADKMHVVGFDFIEEGIRQLAVSNILEIKEA